MCIRDRGYGLVLIKDEKDLIDNLKKQLEKHNKISFSNKEFEKVLNILSKGSVFEKGKTLRERQHIVCLLYTSPSPRDRTRYRMPSSA
mgnify:CR=1 FL=1